MNQAQRDELRTVFLTLWDKAVGTPTYIKAEWKRLDYLIYEVLVRRAESSSPTED